MWGGEATYPVRRCGDVVGGSEDVAPGAGRQYDDWMSQLVRIPAMTPKEHGSAVVTSYRGFYQGGDAPERSATLAATDLSQMDALASAVSALARGMQSLMATGGVADIRTARTN